MKSRRGAFVRVTLTVQNRSRRPQRFVFGQTVLGVAGNNYPESVAERVHPEALAQLQGGVVPPGNTLRGDVIFDVLPEDVDRISTEGRLFITNFGVKSIVQIGDGPARPVPPLRGVPAIGAYGLDGGHTMG